MENNFNPVIEAVVSIRHFALAASNNWSTMNTISTQLNADIETAGALIQKFGSEETKQKWTYEINGYNLDINQLKQIMNTTISKIKNKKKEDLYSAWNEYPKYVTGINKSYVNLKTLGDRSIPENEKENWTILWENIRKAHIQIQNEAKACGLQLKMIESCTPFEVDELTDTILKHIPMHYSLEEANAYTDEYIKAYEDIKKEASQKKNLWDTFLDLLAGGVQQTPAQRVMMQRWVDGEKGDAH